MDSSHASSCVAGHVDWVSKALTKALELAPTGLEIAIRIYITSQTSDQAEDKAWKEDDSIHSADGTLVRRSRPSSLFDFPAVQVIQGRPDIGALLQDEIDNGAGRLSVTGAHTFPLVTVFFVVVPVWLTGGPFTRRT